MTDLATEEVTVHSAMTRLNAIANELGELSQALHAVGQRLEPVEIDYEQHVSDFESGMFDRYESGEGKWPGEETRERLARRTMDADLKREHDRLHAARKRAEKRIGHLKTEADAQRSVLSALKVEMEATS